MAGNADDMITLTGAEQDSGDSNTSDTTTLDTEDLRTTKWGLAITDNTETGIYEATIEGRIAARLVYNRAGNHVTLTATSVLPEFRGKGLAAQLTAHVLDELRKHGRTATITCPFAMAFVNAHPEYADVLGNETGGSVSAASGG